MVVFGSWKSVCHLSNQKQKQISKRDVRDSIQILNHIYYALIAVIGVLQIPKPLAHSCVKFESSLLITAALQQNIVWCEFKKQHS